MIDLNRFEEIWNNISHGPCFPLKVTNRYGSNRIDDVHGNVVIEQPDIWLSEAAEYLVAAGNILPALIAEVKAAREWLRAHDDDWDRAIRDDCRIDELFRPTEGEACEAYRKLVEKSTGEVGDDV